MEKPVKLKLVRKTGWLVFVAYIVVSEDLLWLVGASSNLHADLRYVLCRVHVAGRLDQVFTRLGGRDGGRV